jgi:hypothetical protein
MDELAGWYEVIRALLPEVYMVRLVGEAGVILVGSPYSDEIAYLTEESMAGATPSQVMRRLEADLRPRAHVPHARREAC